MPRDEIVTPVADWTRHEGKDSREQAPDSAEVVKHAQHARGANEDLLTTRAVRRLYPNDRVNALDLRVSLAHFGANRALQRREAQRRSFALVPQHELNVGGAEAASSVVKKE